MQEMITRSPTAMLRDRGPDLGDGADALVAEDAARRHRRHVTLEDVQVGAADRGRVHPHDHVGRVLMIFGSGTSPRPSGPGPWYTSAFIG